MRVGDEDCELTDLDQTINSFQREWAERPADYRTSMNAGSSLYYDDTLVAKKTPVQPVYMQPVDDNDIYEDELVSSGGQLGTFASDPPLPAGRTSQAKRQLPAPPPPSSDSSAFDRTDYLPPEQNGVTK